MKSKPRDWLEETWEIKRRIAKETRNMSFKEYWEYIIRLSNSAKREVKITQKKLVKS